MNLAIPRVARRLRRRATLLKKKSRAHGEEYQKVGKILNGMFPEGLRIKGEQKFSEITLLLRILDKCLRATNLRFKNSQQRLKGQRVQNALDDIGTYSFMWADLVEQNAKKPSQKKSLKELKKLNRLNTRKRPE